MNKEKCPFCGADAELIKSTIEDSDIKIKGSFGFYRYKCSNDSCPEKPSTHEFCDYVNNKTGQKKALEAWNKKEYIPNMKDIFASIVVRAVDKDGKLCSFNKIFEQLSDIWCNLDEHNKGEV
jgi:hypothetical protein